jgi:hypothetical protein
MSFILSKYKYILMVDILYICERIAVGQKRFYDFGEALSLPADKV